MCNATLSIEVLKLHLAALEAIRGTVLGHAVTIGHGQIRRLQVDSQMDLLAVRCAPPGRLPPGAGGARRLVPERAPPRPAGRRHRGDDGAPRNMHR